MQNATAHPGASSTNNLLDNPAEKKSKRVLDLAEIIRLRDRGMIHLQNAAKLGGFSKRLHSQASKAERAKRATQLEELQQFRMLIEVTEAEAASIFDKYRLAPEGAKNMIERKLGMH